MNQPLAQNSDRPYGGNSLLNPEPQEHPVLNWIKLIYLILLTFALIIMFWFLWYKYLLIILVLRLKLCMIRVFLLRLKMGEDFYLDFFAFMCYALGLPGDGDQGNVKK